MAGLLVSAALLAQSGPPARAQGSPAADTGPAEVGAVAFSIAPQPLDGALAAFSAATRIQVLTPGAVTRDVASPGVTGRFSPPEALVRLLAGTGLVARFVNAETVTVEKPPAETGAVELAPLLVEGRSVSRTATIGNLPPEYAGGQVARGGRIGALGNQDAMNVPFSITSYTAETIRNQQAETIGEVLANDPGVRTGYGYGNFSEQFVIRGFPLNADDISIDGLYGIAPRQIVATELYERVEVLKGASAFLNGAAPGGSGIGGGVNLVPKRAGDDPLTRLTASFAQSSRPGLHADVGRRFGELGEFGVRVNALARGGESAIDDEERTTYLGSLGLDYRGERTRLSLDLASQRQRVEQGRPVVFVTGSSVPSAPSAGHNYAQEWSYTDLKDTFGLARGEYDITSNVTAYAAFGARTMREDGDYASPTVDGSGAGTVGRLSVPREDRAESGQLGVNAELATGPLRHRVNVGASGLHHVNRNAYEFGPSAATSIYGASAVPRPATTLAGGDSGDLPKVSETWLRSVYLSDTVSLFDERVMLTVGVRNQDLRVKGYDRATGGETSNYDESAVTPVVGLVVKPWSVLSLYANRIEGLAQGPTAPAAAVNAGAIFAPYRSTQYEIGAKLDLGTFGAGIALFQTKQPSGVTDPVSRVFSVSGEQRNRGIELTLFGEPAPGLRLLGGLTLLDTRLSGTAGGTADGNEAIGAPNYQANLGAEWDLPFLRQVTLAGRLVHTGAQYLDAANTLQIPAWTRLDIGARLTTGFDDRTLVFRAFVENVTNEAYWASANGGYLTQGNPLTAKLSVSVDF